MRAAAAADATAALAINPDSAKGYKLRGKARRLLGVARHGLGLRGELRLPPKPLGVRPELDDGVARRRRPRRHELRRRRRGVAQPARLVPELVSLGHERPHHGVLRLARPLERLELCMQCADPCMRIRQLLLSLAGSPLRRVSSCTCSARRLLC